MHAFAFMSLHYRDTCIVDVLRLIVLIFQNAQIQIHFHVFSGGVDISENLAGTSGGIPLWLASEVYALSCRKK